MTDSSTRASELERAGEVMREFMARAVLFQDAVAKWGGVNSTDLQCAGLLISEGPATPGELAERTGLTAGGAITTVIDRLERQGYVSRDRDPNDRRRVIVTADPEAVFARFGAVYGRVGARWNAYLETLSDEQLAFANDLFARAAEVNREEIEQLRAHPGV
ncbi:MarR family winged helix-turn-helix transcriptional regulator [Microbacterium aurantiacum]|uniref:MarR family winged helix-turn-helix transcriptional regulator n=1 Tax=Microbacterium aurantiacum TaxID=162393 RepID=UPI000C809DCD|nr:MarR family transcriptional regulator [Microbacterium aurantiacum]